MSFIWLIVWLIKGTPDIRFGEDWNNWAIALVVCLVIDVLGALKA